MLTLLMAAAMAPDTATAATPGRLQRPPGGLIDVPYLSQTPQLCGGAALAMVLRYWGGSARPQDFANLIDSAAGGIATSRLADAARERGWQSIATAAPGDQPIGAVDAHVVQGRPVIALIDADAPVHHYVVIVGVTPDAVVLHDPARAPYVVMTRDEFEKRWKASAHWMLLVLPATDTAFTDVEERDSTAIESSQPVSPCEVLVAEGVAEARAGREAAAERILRSAIALCPDSAAGYRELSGLRLVQRRWHESSALAEQAAARDGDDAHTWQVLAASRFASGDRQGALAAWNAIGTPEIDSITVEGLRHTHEPVVTTLMGLRPSEILTRRSFVRATRRLEELPTSTAATLRYTPLRSGTVSVAASVNEGPRVPSGWTGWSTVAIRAATTDEIRVDLAALASQGDRWQPSFRWPYERRRVGLVLAMPVPGISGVVRVEGFRERQTYARESLDPERFEEMRRRIGASYANWLAAPVRIEVGVASDRLADNPYVALNAGTTLRFGDRVAAHARMEHWLASGQNLTDVTSADARIDWRSTAEPDVPRWTTRVGMAAVSDAAPLALWPGAGAFLDRTTLLRGHRLIRDQVLSGPVFGRRLAFATLERHHPVLRSRYGSLAVAGFADAARAWQRLDGSASSPVHVDVGAGLRVSRPGDTTELRIDLGVGLRDGDVRLSAGYVTGWGRR